MANDAEMTGVSDKGKGKATDPSTDKPTANGKKDDGKLNCEHRKPLATCYGHS
jgi:hypothetical protein